MARMNTKPVCTQTKSVVLFYFFVLMLVTTTSSFAQKMSIPKTYFKPGEAIIVQFTAPGNYATNAWIGIIPSNISHGSEAVNDQNDLTYQYLSGNTSGSFTFAAPTTLGNYDFRMHDTDSDGREVASVSFIVSNSIPESAPVGSGKLSIPKNSFSKNENISVSFNVPSGLPDNAWIGIIPSNIPHGDEVVNDQHDITYQYLQGKTSGTLLFKAPDTDGSWDLRLNSSDSEGKEIASVSFIVGGASTNNQSQPNYNTPTQQALPTPEGAVIFDNWNKAGVDNNPGGATYFYLSRQTTITRIMNYHWNYGSGRTAGMIGIKGSNGTVYGTWNSVATSGTGGAQNVNWVVMPNVTLSPGVYQITDSDSGTWSNNAGSFGCGFSSVTGK